jgi:hypothetical protein
VASDPRLVNLLVERALERLEGLDPDVDEFEANFGSWRRPEFAVRYDLPALGRRIRWDQRGDGVLDVSPLILALAPEDRRVAGEIARWVVERYFSDPATDATLRRFREDLLRRLSSVGF